MIGQGLESAALYEKGPEYPGGQDYGKEREEGAKSMSAGQQSGGERNHSQRNGIKEMDVTINITEGPGTKVDACRDSSSKLDRNGSYRGD